MKKPRHCTGAKLIAQTSLERKGFIERGRQAPSFKNITFASFANYRCTINGSRFANRVFDLEGIIGERFNIYQTTSRLGIGYRDGVTLLRYGKCSPRTRSADKHISRFFGESKVEERLVATSIRTKTSNRTREGFTLQGRIGHETISSGSKGTSIGTKRIGRSCSNADDVIVFH